MSLVLKIRVTDEQLMYLSSVASVLSDRTIEDLISDLIDDDMAASQNGQLDAGGLSAFPGMDELLDEFGRIGGGVRSAVAPWSPYDELFIG
jgi:hypothetical protein